jgi:hypothetical protein
VHRTFKVRCTLRHDTLHFTLRHDTLHFTLRHDPLRCTALTLNALQLPCHRTKQKPHDNPHAIQLNIAK